MRRNDAPMASIDGIPEESDRHVDPFEAAYMEPSPTRASRRRRARRRRSALVRAAPSEAFALKGWVLDPDRAIKDGYVVVGAGHTIKAVTETRPEGVPVMETDGVILPGLIDLHGHPEFNVFAAWEPPKQFVNRYAWRGSDLYKQLVREPQDHLLKAAAGEDPAALRRDPRAGGRRDRDPGHRRPGRRATRTRRWCATSTCGSSARTADAR